MQDNFRITYPIRVITSFSKMFIHVYIAIIRGVRLVRVVSTVLYQQPGCNNPCYNIFFVCLFVRLLFFL